MGIMTHLERELFRLKLSSREIANSLLIESQRLKRIGHLNWKMGGNGKRFKLLKSADKMSRLREI